MQLSTLTLKNFRCFEQKELQLDAPIILIEGNNGVGKTSIIEALYYLCYLKSFRTHLPRELIKFDEDTFYLQARFEDTDATQHALSIGFQHKKRMVKLDQKSIVSYKELIDHFRIVCLSEDDLDLIKGAPDVRRSFMDQYLLLQEPQMVEQLRSYRSIIENRNALLQQHSSREMYDLWTKQLWESAVTIQDKRQEQLRILEQEMRELCAAYLDDAYSIDLVYNYKKKPHETLAAFKEAYPLLYADEHRMRRSLFGAHLDDLVVKFQDKRSKTFASRGQQKLLVLLLKVAQIKILYRSKGPCIFLLDDFMTDFDMKRLEQFIILLQSIECQLIFTSPITNSPLRELLGARCQIVSL